MLSPEPYGPTSSTKNVAYRWPNWFCGSGPSPMIIARPPRMSRHTTVPLVWKPCDSLIEYVPVTTPFTSRWASNSKVLMYDWLM